MHYDKHDFLRLGWDESQKMFYEAHKVAIRKRSAQIIKEAKQKAKRQTCYICGKECSSFCVSHSVPQVFLKRIATNGKVYFTAMQHDIPILGPDTGIREAGTFRLICRECDSKVFQDYEDVSAYTQPPTQKMLCEIAMKNYLLMIGKRLQEYEIYTTLHQAHPDISFFEEQKTAISLDLSEYMAGFEHTQRSLKKSKDNAYYLFYYQELNHVVPLAMQGLITLIADFEDNLVNNISNMSPDYHTRSMHVAIFPLESTSIVMMFCAGQEKTYRRFYRQLKKLNQTDQLAAIHYIIHSYCENIFLSKSIPEDTLKSPELQDVCQRCTVSKKGIPDTTAREIKEFSLSKFREIPNLLDKQYAIDS